MTDAQEAKLRVRKRIRQLYDSAVQNERERCAKIAEPVDEVLAAVIRKEDK